MGADRGAPASFRASQSRRGRLGRLTACRGQPNLLGASIIWIIDASNQSVSLQLAWASNISSDASNGWAAMDLRA
jgi:hypothetical protein